MVFNELLKIWDSVCKLSFCILKLFEISTTQQMSNYSLPKNSRLQHYLMVTILLEVLLQVPCTLHWHLAKIVLKQELFQIGLQIITPLNAGTVVYFAQQMCAISCLCMVQNNEKH